ncbi:putative bifunctional diguanylate cyclase/phosphodiesterase [Maritalea sp.]|uniref:putative bifunctional diguanylate cyclase/phosphodiesterase n=1 Tax=Maritalea sp. TaxID=2003361 RepID=UPI003EF8414F
MHTFSQLFSGLKLRFRGNRLKRELRRIRAENAVMEMIVNNANDGLIIQDVNGIVEWCNPAYEKLTGYSAKEILGRKPQEFVFPEGAKKTPQEIADFRYDITPGAMENLECIQNARKNGELFWNQLSFAVSRHSDLDEPKVIVITRDITEQVEHQKELKRSEARNRALAENDALTKLPNRMKLSAYLDKQVAKAEKLGTKVGLLHLDLDRFKAINDSLGHDAGDTVLERAASIMRHIVGDLGMAGRLGGDEFLIVCPDVESFAPLEELGRRILRQIHKPIEHDEHLISVGCSIGIAISSENGRSANELMKHADVALYDVKRSGRDGMSSFNQELGRAYERQMALSSQLAQSIGNGELIVDIQPQYSLAANEVHGFEALIRWHHPVYGKLAPGEFLPVAEQNGLMSEIDKVAMWGALDALKDMRDLGYNKMRMSINISAATLNSPNFIKRLIQEVARRGLSNAQVTIEVLESNLLEGTTGYNLETIQALGQAGFKVELDDFGMGHAGLAHLAKIATNGVKIDRAMVRDMMHDKATLTIVRAVINLCAELGLSVVAEGIETKEQAELLLAAGCDVIQGYGVERPMPVDAAIEWLQQLCIPPIVEELLPVPDRFEIVRKELAS